MTADCGLDSSLGRSQHTEGNQIEFLGVEFTIVILITRVDHVTLH